MRAATWSKHLQKIARWPRANRRSRLLLPEAQALRSEIELFCALRWRKIAISCQDGMRISWTTLQCAAPTFALELIWYWYCSPATFNREADASDIRVHDTLETQSTEPEMEASYSSISSVNSPDMRLLFVIDAIICFSHSTGQYTKRGYVGVEAFCSTGCSLGVLKAHNKRRALGSVFQRLDATIDAEKEFYWSLSYSCCVWDLLSVGSCLQPVRSILKRVVSLFIADANRFCFIIQHLPDHQARNHASLSTRKKLSMSGVPGRSSVSSPGDGDASVENFLPQGEQDQGPRQPVLRPNQMWPARMIQRFGNLELSYRNCCVWFGILACGMALVPVKDYILGSYVTQTFDEVRDDLVARTLNNFDAVTSTVHYYDTFARDSLPLFDTLNQTRMTRNGSRSRTLIDFLVHTSVNRADLYTALPEALLSATVSVMDDYYAPICGPASQTDAQLLFGNYFPAIHHEFCREFGDKFPRERFFVKASGSSSSSPSFEYVAPLGVIGLVNMSEVYLRHFRSVEVVRTLTRSVLSGFLGDENASSSSSWQVNFSDDAANTIVKRYAGGITIAEAITLLPGASDVATDDHIRLVDLVGMKPVLAYFLTPQVLSMGLNLNAEDAVQAEISYATVSVLSLDYLVTILGMGPVFPTYMAPFWNCGIELTTMSKDVAVESLDPAKFYRCGFQKASVLPAYIVNLLYLTQKSFRDYAKLDNTSLFVVGPNRAVAFDVPEKLVSSPLLLIDGAAWSKANNLQIQQPLIPSTPYGYLYTRDCKHLVDAAFAQQGRNVQKYQAYIGDGVGDCRFHDSQETELQVLCRLVFRVDEILLRDLDGNVHSNISACSDLAPLTSLEQQSNFRQIEWFLIDTTTLAKRTRIRDNTSRQIRTFLLLLSLIGSIYYVVEYLAILKSLMVFIRNSLSVPQASSSSSSAQTVRIQEFAQFDPAVGALQHPITIVLIYLGAVGALSNTFSLACHAEIASEDGTIAIFCRPSIAITSVWLLFTVLSSGFWIALITQQTRKIGRRLRSHADPNWVRKWMTSHCAVLVIYLICKASTDLVLENVMLRSDPHLYAICGGLLLSFLISIAFRIVHYSHRRSSADKVVNSDAAVASNRRHLVRFPSFSAHDTTAQEQNVLSRWSSTHLDGVLQNCASPTIALQLIWYCSMKRSYEDLLMPQSASKYQSALVASSSFRIHEFVALHTAAGAWTHLETLAWSFDDTHTKLSLRRTALKALQKKVDRSKAGTATVVAT